MHVENVAMFPASGETSVSAHKAAFGDTGAEAPPLTEANVYSRFPTAVSHEGTINETGMVFRDGNGNIVAAVTSPVWIPDQGPQRESHVIPWNIRDLGETLETRIAQYMIFRAKRGWSVGASGVEREAWRIDPRGGGKLVAVERAQQIETHRGMLEEVQRPQREPWLQRRDTARYLSALLAKDPHHIISESSVPPVGSPNDEGFSLNNGHEAAYIRTVHPILKELANARDPYARQIADFVARKYGRVCFLGTVRFKDFDAMRKGLPDVRYWGSAARHRSKQLPHYELEGEPHPAVPARIACAVGDIYASDLGAVAKLLGFGSPLLFGESPAVMTPAGPKQPRDYRALLQLVLDTAYPGEFTYDHQTMQARICAGMLDGAIPTPARGAFIDPVSNAYTYHSDVRIRGDSNGFSGRIENTSMGATQWPDDEVASDILLDMLTVSAMEAVAHGERIDHYFAGRYNNMLSGNASRLAIVLGYNLDGRHDPTARLAIEGCLDYIDDMIRSYPAYTADLLFAQQRIANLLAEPTTNDIGTYYYQPNGCFSEVVQAALASGVSPIEAERQKCALQRKRFDDFSR